MKAKLLTTVFASVMVFGAQAHATSGSQDQQTDYESRHDEPEEGESSGYVTTVPDRTDPSILEMTPTPDEFTTRNQGSDMDNSDSKTSSEHEDGTTGQDRGY